MVVWNKRLSGKGPRQNKEKIPGQKQELRTSGGTKEAIQSSLQAHTLFGKRGIRVKQKPALR